MSDIENLHNRISSAMQKVSAGVARMQANVASASQLAERLEEERTVSAQLEERLKQLKENQATEMEALQAQMAELQDRIETVDVEMQKMREIAAQLRNANAALREANAEGVGDAQLINDGLRAELEALKVERAADVAEMSAILSALRPALQSAPATEEVKHA